MFSSAVQPGIVSLFSSTGSDPLTLFETRSDSSLPSDSFICLLKDSTSLPTPAPPQTLISPLRITKPSEEAQGPEDSAERSDHNDTANANTVALEGYRLHQTVLHVQSPTMRTTYVRCPRRRRDSLGLKHPWMHLQVRNLGREWAFEVGLVDRAGREGVVRCSTFQVPLVFSPFFLR